MAGRLTLLLTSPRVAAALLSREAWRALEEADLVAGREDEPQVHGIQQAGMPVTHLAADPPFGLARALVAEATAAGGRAVVWVGSADADPGLTDALAAEVTRHRAPPDVEVLLASYDVPGARVLDLVAVMDRLRSPGGCPWDAAQTHETLVPYLVEEAHEAAEAIESGDRDHIVEELGDVLLQVAFHARVAQEHPEDPFDIDDVAAAVVAKLVRRHPHVFAEGPDALAASTPGAVAASWESIKAAEQEARRAATGGAAGERGLLHGIPAGLPALARAAKVLSRVQRAGRPELLAALAQATSAGDPGARLLALVAELARDGVDPEAALRATLRALGERVGAGAEPAERIG